MAQPQSRIVGLASSIATGTAAIDKYLSEHGLPSPSFDVDCPIVLDLPRELQQTRDSVLEASKELQALILGPVGIVHHQTLEVRRSSEPIGWHISNDKFHLAYQPHRAPSYISLWGSLKFSS